MIDSLKIENGKYEIILQDNYEVEIYRHGELSVINPPHPKMLIALIYEFQKLGEQNKILKECVELFTNDYDSHDVNRIASNTLIEIEEIK